MKAICVVSIVAFATASIGATDWTVGPNGSGAQFATIQAAIDAAQPGDRVLVMAGDYNGAVVIDKAIELIGAGSSVTTSNALTSFVPGQTPIPAIIGNISAGSHVRVSGLTFTFVGFMTIANTAMMFIHDCAGRVELSDIRLPGAALPTLPSATYGGMLRVRDCAEVVASGLKALGTPDGAGFAIFGESNLRRGHAGVFVERSAFWMVDSTASGKSTPAVLNGFGGDGGDGIRAVDSFVHVARSEVKGAQSGGQQVGVVGFGGAGINAISSYVLVHGGDPNLIAGANAFEPVGPGFAAYGAAGSAAALDATSTLVFAPDAVFVAGTGSASLPAAPLIASVPGSTVAPHPHRLPVVSITPTNAPVGGTVSVHLSGEPNIDLIRAIALQTAAPLFIPGVLGAVVVDLQAVLLYSVTPLGPSGTVTSNVTLPADPGLAGLEFIEQAAQVLPTGIALSPPIVFCINV